MLEEEEQRGTSGYVENEIEVRAECCTLSTLLQVHTSEGLSKLVSDLKEYLILNDFSTVNDSCSQHISELAAAQAQNQTELEALYSHGCTASRLDPSHS